MTELPIYDLWRGALMTTVTVAAPFILMALAVGLTMSIIQAATQLQENVLSFVPKLVALVAVVTLAGPWALDRLTSYTKEAAATIESIGKASPR